MNYTTSTAADGSWVRVYVTFTAKVSGSHTLSVCSNGVPGIFCTDNVQLKKGEGPSRYNMVENGSMEMSHYIICKPPLIASPRLLEFRGIISY